MTNSWKCHKRWTDLRKCPPEHPGRVALHDWDVGVVGLVVIIVITVAITVVAVVVVATAWQRLGPLHAGWSVAMTTLSFERAGVARLHLSLEACYCSVLDECWTTDLGPTSDPVPVDECVKKADAYIE